jgi:polysaccharide biosynthesis protein PelG
MAGIGFELQRALRRGGIGSAIKTALAGMVIVAGPWLVSIVGIFFLNRYAGLALHEGQDLFMAVIVYSYAFSLGIFGGAHYVFTRYISDLVYEKKENRAMAALLAAMLAVSVLAALIGAVAVTGLKLDGLTSPDLFRAAAVILFVSINLVWVLMLFITMLKWYLAIFLVYLAGMTVSFWAVWAMGSVWGLGGAVCGFAVGQLLIVLLLTALSLKAYWPTRPGAELRPLAACFRRYRLLFAAGCFYSWGLWIDKIVFWLMRGEPVAGTWLRLYESYDRMIYFVNLTVIPGLVYFIVFTEPGFYVALRRFLLHLDRHILSRILNEQYRLLRELDHQLAGQSIFQGVLSLGLAILAIQVDRLLLGGLAAPDAFRLTLAAGFMNLIFLTLVTFLYYLEMYQESVLVTAVFLVLNAAGSIAAAAWGWLPGTGYAGAGTLASVLAYALLRGGIKNLFRRIFSRQ